MKSKYIVNEEKRTVVCILTSCRYDLINWVVKHAHYLCAPGYAPDLIIDNEFVGVAKCNPDDTFDEKIGKRIAGIRAMRKYENARTDKLIEVFYDKANEVFRLMGMQIDRYNKYPSKISVSDIKC